MEFIARSIPLWFANSGIMLEVIFALVSLMIAFYTYKIYKISKQRYIFLFGLSFFSLGIAYFLQASINFLIQQSVNSSDIISSIMPVKQIPVFQLSILAISLHILFMISGWALLSYVTLKERNSRIFFLLTTISFIGLIFSKQLILSYYLLSSLFLGFITFQHYKKHSQQKTISSMIIFFGFGLILLGNLQLAVSAFSIIFYFLGHLTALAGYVLLLVNLIRVVK